MPLGRQWPTQPPGLTEKVTGHTGSFFYINAEFKTESHHSQLGVNTVKVPFYYSKKGPSGPESSDIFPRTFTSLNSSPLSVSCASPAFMSSCCKNFPWFHFKAWDLWLLGLIRLALLRWLLFIQAYQSLNLGKNFKVTELGPRIYISRMKKFQARAGDMTGFLRSTLMRSIPWDPCGGRSRPTQVVLWPSLHTHRGCGLCLPNPPTPKIKEYSKKKKS